MTMAAFYILNRGLFKQIPHYASCSRIKRRRRRPQPATIFRVPRSTTLSSPLQMQRRAAAWKYRATWRVPFSSVALKVRCARGTTTTGRTGHWHPYTRRL